jgi:hypothetical protein
MDEQHNYFPSGIWDGFYLYVDGPDTHRHEMYFYLDFKGGVVTGSGSDDVGGFTWSGTYDAETYLVAMSKQYSSHEVHYKGMADESGIYGQWRIPYNLSGGFHIWPRKGEEAEAEAIEISTEELVISRL